MHFLETSIHKSIAYNNSPPPTNRNLNTLQLIAGIISITNFLQKNDLKSNDSDDLKKYPQTTINNGIWNVYINLYRTFWSLRSYEKASVA